MVEIGNEISNGFLWPDGQLTWKCQDDEGWQRLSDLLKATEDGVVQGAGSKRKPLILIHLDTGGDTPKCKSFFDHILARGVHFDVIGLSDYPWWQGTLEQLSGNLAALATAYHKPIIVVETGFPWSPQSFEVERPHLYRRCRGGECASLSANNRGTSRLSEKTNQNRPVDPRWAWCGRALLGRNVGTKQKLGCAGMVGRLGSSSTVR